MDRTIQCICIQCSKEFNFLVSEWQFERLSVGENPHKVFDKSHAEHVLLITTRLCNNCWSELEKEFE